MSQFIIDDSGSVPQRHSALASPTKRAEVAPPRKSIPSPKKAAPAKAPVKRQPLPKPAVEDDDGWEEF